MRKIIKFQRKITSELMEPQLEIQQTMSYSYYRFGIKYRLFNWLALNNDKNTHRNTYTLNLGSVRSRPTDCQEWCHGQYTKISLSRSNKVQTGKSTDEMWKITNDCRKWCCGAINVVWKNSSRYGQQTHYSHPIRSCSAVWLSVSFRWQAYSLLYHDKIE